ncbi:hypothetical protein ElyMa_006319900 [Elysia marginata]|uniref:G-protein coupled receptors family 1 profile domain-containing protein n=1 Tax=Elysia marginata TaxID=1093978 RepID=A0AAV4HH43_9GAST|nr:hypothetical protein ElyMa_006319900 [Elysia marginata]
MPPTSHGRVAALHGFWHTPKQVSPAPLLRFTLFGHASSDQVFHVALTDLTHVNTGFSQVFHVAVTVLTHVRTGFSPVFYLALTVLTHVNTGFSPGFCVCVVVLAHFSTGVSPVFNVSLTVFTHVNTGVSPVFCAVWHMSTRFYPVFLVAPRVLAQRCSSADSRDTDTRPSVFVPCPLHVDMGDVVQGTNAGFQNSPYFQFSKVLTYTN